MGLNITNSMPLAIKALDFRAYRQKMISSNIANVDTPYYRSRDIRFEDILKNEAKKLHGETNRNLELAKTNPLHLTFEDQDDANKAKVFFRGTHPTRNDANNVDIDIESTEMSKNAIMFEALTSAIKKEGMIFKSVLEASGKIQ